MRITLPNTAGGSSNERPLVAVPTVGWSLVNNDMAYPSQSFVQGTPSPSPVVVSSGGGFRTVQRPAAVTGTQWASEVRAIDPAGVICKVALLGRNGTNWIGAALKSGDNSGVIVYEQDGLYLVQKQAAGVVVGEVAVLQGWPGWFKWTNADGLSVSFTGLDGSFIAVPRFGADIQADIGTVTAAGWAMVYQDGNAPVGATLQSWEPL